MTKYKVEKKEVFNITYLVEAENEKQARELVESGQGEELEIDYWKDLSEYNIDTELMVHKHE